MKNLKDLIFPDTLEKLITAVKSDFQPSFNYLDGTFNKDNVNPRNKVIVVDDALVRLVEAVCDKSYLSFALNTIQSYLQIFGNVRFGENVDRAINNAMRSLGLTYADFAPTMSELANIWVDATCCVDIEDEWRNSASAYLKQVALWESGESDVNPTEQVINVWSECINSELGGFINTYASRKFQRLSPVIVSYRNGVITLLWSEVTTVPSASSYMFRIIDSRYAVDTNFDSISSAYSNLVSDDDAINVATNHMTRVWSRPMIGGFSARIPRMTNRFIGVPIIDDLLVRTIPEALYHVHEISHHGIMTRYLLGITYYLTDPDDDESGITFTPNGTQVYGFVIADYLQTNIEASCVTGDPKKLLFSTIINSIVRVNYFVSLCVKHGASNVLKKLKPYLLESLELERSVFKEAYIDRIQPNWHVHCIDDFDHLKEAIIAEDPELFDPVLFRGYPAYVQQFGDADGVYKSPNFVYAVKQPDGLIGIINMAIGNKYLITDTMKDYFHSSIKVVSAVEKLLMAYDE